MNSGFIILDKPEGITSFKVLLPLRKLFQTKRVGHAGTLDMSASGLIIAAVGKCTRLLQFIEAQEKVYAFTLHLGTLTDTLELTGEVIKQDANPKRSAKELNSALRNFLGETEQVPPDYSAVKINGKRASDIALAGKCPELKPRGITIHELYLLENHNEEEPRKEFLLHCKCSKGTYIRALARDIGEKLGTCACVSGIRRLAIGGICVERASEKLIAPQELLNWSTVNINEAEKVKIMQGQPVNHERKFCNGEFVFVNHNEQTIAVAEANNNFLIPKFLL